MAVYMKPFFYVFVALCILNAVLGRPQDVPDKAQKGLKEAEGEDLKTANSYGFGYGLGYGYPYGYYGLHGLGGYGYGYGYGYPYYGYYGAYGYPFYG